MPTANIVFNPTLAEIDEIIVDASISEQHNSEVEVTDHDVEEGSPISDHARVKPVTLTMEALITNTPINRGQALRIVESNGIQFQTPNQSEQLRGVAGYAEQSFAKLETLRDSVKLITVITALKTYSNMILTSLSVPRNASIGEALRFTATFKSVRLVKNQTTQTKVTKTTQGQGKKKLGRLPTKPVPPAEKAVRERTGLAAIADGAADIIKNLPDLR